jgi:hypothetical protein
MVSYRLPRIFKHSSIRAVCLSILISVSASAVEWRTAYDGFGRVQIRENSVRLTPQASTRADETHAALVLLPQTERRPVRDFRVTFRYRVRQQLRQPASEVNPWETLWLFFNYRTEGENKETNYLLLKPNGLEIGKAWGEKEQAFLHTSPRPRVTDPGNWQEVEIERRGNELFVTLNRGLTEQIALSGRNTLFSYRGSIGLYTEDADVEVRDFVIDP